MMPEITTENIIAAENQVEIDPNAPYLRAYPEILRYFMPVFRLIHPPIFRIIHPPVPRPA